MQNPAGSGDQDVEVLLRLRATPELFAEIGQSSDAELFTQKRLREQFDPELVRHALSVTEARRKAAGRLPRAEHLWLTRVGLEQSTAWEVAGHKALRFQQAEHVWDLCSGIGVDAGRLATVTRVTAVDMAPAMNLRTQWNTQTWGATTPVETRCQDVTQLSWEGQLVHVDPDRRTESDRPVRRLEDYVPDLTWMQNLTRSAAGGAIKIGPASNFLQKFPGCETELISLHGECREATIWFGELAGAAPFRATILPSGESLAADPLSVWTQTTERVGPLLFDPDPAIVRSGLLDVMAEQHQLLRLDSEEEYLTGDTLPKTGFVTPFFVETIVPGDLRHLKAWLRQQPSTSYEVKCRHIHVNAEVVRRQLPRGDGPPRTIFFARCGGRSMLIVARRSPDS